MFFIKGQNYLIKNRIVSKGKENGKKCEKINPYKFNREICIYLSIALMRE